MAEQRQDLFTLFKNAAKLAPAEAYSFVGRQLAAALSPAGGGGPDAGGGAAWQDVEIALSLLYQLGEGAPEEALRPGSGMLAQLAGGLFGADVPAASHRLVALALLECYVRYAKVAAQQAQHVAKVVGAFLGERGMGHPSEAVARRAAYLLCRLVKPLRGSLRPLTREILGQLQPHLAAIAATPAPEAPAVKSSGAAGGRPTAGALLGTVDDRLYAFEAAGLLLGQEELPAAEQAAWLAALLCPLVAAVESNLDAAAAQQRQGLGPQQGLGLGSQQQQQGQQQQ